MGTMPNFDASTAEVLVFTFKDGLLSPMAHDLKIRVHRFTVEVEGDAVTGTFEADSLKVEGVRKDGVDAQSMMPEVAFSEIEKNINTDVLTTWRHPRIRFKSTLVTETTVEGLLTLCSVSKQITGRRADDATHRVATFDIDQRDFGIRPYTAMLGTLKVKPQVTVQVRIPR